MAQKHETALATVDKATAEIERVLDTCNTIQLKELPTLRQAVVLATGVTQLRRVMNDDLVREVFMPLQGTPLGFQTDRDNAKDGKPREYSIQTVRECMIEAMVAGFRPVGNEINIIAGRTYGAKAGYQRKVSEFPGLTDLRMTPGVPYMIGEKGALVAYRASWKLNGAPMELVRDLLPGADGIKRDTRIAVRVNSMMGPDAIIGKATRKMLKAIYDMVSGSTFTLEDGDVDSIDTSGVVVDVAPSPAPPENDGQRMKMGGNEKPASAPQNTAPEPRQERLREMGDD